MLAGKIVSLDFFSKKKLPSILAIRVFHSRSLCIRLKQEEYKVEKKQTQNNNDNKNPLGFDTHTFGAFSKMGMLQKGSKTTPTLTLLHPGLLF